jgi:alkanesulfonate monooxygenase SsuD/methylene tetrahydromethanopterin reductase-like flavin-dependent oxidoreductase (luciferase family)
MLSRVIFLIFLFQLPFSAWAESSSVHRPIRFGIFTPQGVESLGDLTILWQQAETWGYDSLWLCDHLLSLSMPKENAPIYESWSLLAVLAMETSRARIGVMVTSNTFRLP